MIPVAKALAHLHANGVVHGQLRPSVIRIKDDGNVTMTHTGAYTAVCRVLLPHTQSIPLQKSFVYHAPEFVTMDAPYAPTKEMDVYAFGSTLYTVFTGVMPFDSRHCRLETTIAEIGYLGHRRLPQPDGIGDGLWEIIRSCWKYDPVTRPQMKYVADSLAALLPQVSSHSIAE